LDDMSKSIKSEDELFVKLKPALTVKKNELRLMGVDYIKLSDIWLYLKEVKWTLEEDLDLASMVSDILNCKKDDILYHFGQKLKETRSEKDEEI